MPKAKKRLRAKVVVGHGPDGAPIVKYAQGYTKKELAVNTEELRRTYINGAIAVQRDVLFGAYVSEWYDTYKKNATSRRTGKKLRESTKENYQLAINNYIFPAFAERQMRAITAMELQRFMDSLGSHGSTLIGDAYNVLRAVFARAYATGIVDRTPTEGLLKPQATKQEPRRALTDAETAAVLSLIDTSADGLLLALLYYTGMRRGEALGLQWFDVDLRGQWLRVQRDIDHHHDAVDEVKTKNALRSIPLPDPLCELLRACQKIGNGYVVESPRTHSFWGSATYARHWRSIRQRLLAAAPGIDAVEVGKQTGKDGKETSVLGSVLTAHYFRHNYASLLHKAGVDVMSAQRFLGHSDPLTTMRIYTHLSDDVCETDADKTRRALSGNFLATVATDAQIHERPQS